jgi:hypothetical protein
MKYLIAFCVGAIAWRAGGAINKLFRRVGIPAVIAGSQAKKRPWWAILGLFSSLYGVLSLGYGESKPYWYKFLVGCAWIVPRFVFMGFSPIACAVPVVWISLFWLSNHKPYSDIFKWQWVELGIGGILGLAYV